MLFTIRSNWQPTIGLVNSNKIETMIPEHIVIKITDAYLYHQKPFYKHCLSGATAWMSNLIISMTFCEMFFLIHVLASMVV